MLSSHASNYQLAHDRAELKFRSLGLWALLSHTFPWNNPFPEREVNTSPGQGFLLETEGRAQVPAASSFFFLWGPLNLAGVLFGLLIFQVSAGTGMEEDGWRSC